jgi:XTP/dITP diphosphohydrolase
MPRQLLVATRNPGKLAELVPMFAAVGIEVVDLAGAGVPRTPAEDAVEAFDTFAENALAKAHYYHAASGGRPTLADDSGLEVEALGGAPGVHSRRFSGVEGDERSVAAANTALLLERLRDVADRRARFTCAAALVGWGEPLVVHGATAGRILPSPAGEGGFGYDPVFHSDEIGRSFGEATREEKGAISHRGRAVRALLSALAARGG